MSSEQVQDVTSPHDGELKRGAMAQLKQLKDAYGIEPVSRGFGRY